MQDAWTRSYRVGESAFVVRSPSVWGSAEGEAQLSRRGVSVPTDHRKDWAEAWGSTGRVVEVWADGTPLCLATFVMEASRSRALPGHELWRVDRLGGYPDAAPMVAALQGMVDLAAGERRVLELSVGLSPSEPEVRPSLASRAASLGLSRSATPASYAYTSRIDVDREEDALLARMRPSCRRSLRAVAREPIEIRLVDDPRWAPTLGTLLEETMRRTGGSPSGRPWRRVIEYVKENPQSSRLVGMFDTSGGADRMIAFALGLRQGDHVEYRTAASTRSGVSVSVGHALAWDLILWAKDIGADWFDFGGLPRPVPRELEGIVRFKQSFGGCSVDFRQEWTLTPHPRLAAARRGLAACRDRIRRAWRRPR